MAVQQGRQPPSAMDSRTVTDVKGALSWVAAEPNGPTMADADPASYHLGFMMENLTPLD